VLGLAASASVVVAIGLIVRLHPPPTRLADPRCRQRRRPRRGSRDGGRAACSAAAGPTTGSTSCRSRGAWPCRRVDR